VSALARPCEARELVLVCHPDTSVAAVRGIDTSVTRGADGHLALAYRLSGVIDRLLIPARQPQGRGDNLWEHTCFEVFIAVGGVAAYHEFNFSPSGQWAAYAFAGYRQRDAAGSRQLASISSPQIVTRRLADRLELDAIVSADALPSGAATATLELGVSAVAEAADGRRSYWALRHATVRPDFHQRDTFILELAVPPTTA
jgi:hypothetical protein